MTKPLIVEAHLDLALNAVSHLIDHTKTISELRALEIHFFAPITAPMSLLSVPGLPVVNMVLCHL